VRPYTVCILHPCTTRCRITAAVAVAQLPSMKERKRKRTAVYNSETLVRSVRFMRYCLVCSASLVRAVVRFWNSAARQPLLQLGQLRLPARIRLVLPG